MKKAIFMSMCVGLLTTICSTYASGGYVLKPVSDIAHSGEIHGTIDFCGEYGSGGTFVYIPGKSIGAKVGVSGNFELLFVKPATYNIVYEIPGQPLQIIENVEVVKKNITDLGTISYCPDKDNDGYDVSVDCNDNNQTIHPDADEVCDGVDNNCNDNVDEGCAICTDDDNDTYFAQGGCGTDVDCNDSNANISPNAIESCQDDLDNNCDGYVNENCPVDADGDGFTADGGDCNDSDATINPTAEDICDGYDNDCDNQIDESVYPCTLDTGVCGGSNATCNNGILLPCSAVNYGEYYEAPEVSCDNLDNDCDGVVDEPCY